MNMTGVTMAKIAEFNKDNLDILRRDINAALAAVGAKHGIGMKIGNIRFNRDSFTTKLDAAVLIPGATAADSQFAKYAADYKRYAPLYGYPIALLNNGQVTYNGKNYTILGYNSRGKRYPIIARGVGDGKVYKLPESAVRSK